MPRHHNHLSQETVNLSPETAPPHPRNLSQRPFYLSLQAALALLPRLRPHPVPATPTPTPAPLPAAPTTPDDPEARRLAELPHRVVFADRITYSYVLLLPGDPQPAPARHELAAAVRKAFAANLEDDEVQLLLDLVSRPEREFVVRSTPDSAPDPASAPDLIGLAVEAHPRTPPQGPP
jgi:hypothetical protein